MQRKSVDVIEEDTIVETFRNFNLVQFNSELFTVWKSSLGNCPNKALHVAVIENICLLKGLNF